MSKDFKIESIQINNFKNVCNGKVDFVDNEGFINLLGLYGQNGSGKTTLITAIEFCKLLITGRTIEEEMFDLESLLRFDVNSSIEVTFIMGEWTFIYSITLIKRLITIRNNDVESKKTDISIINETLKYKKREQGARPSIFISYELEEGQNFSLRPVTRFPLNNINKTIINTAFKSFDNKFGSIIFNNLLFELIENGYKEEEIIEIVKEFQIKVRRDIFVFTNQSNGLINFNMGAPLPMYFYYNNNGRAISGVFPLPTNSSTKISERELGIVENVITQINMVLPQLVPNLEIGVKVLSNELDNKGDIVNEIEVVSIRKDITIPFRAESDGIKKIVSILSSLIHAYSSSEAIVLIDELDSGIFEYLLGELLVSLNEVMSGQIIFTSHNLRALEVLKVRNVIFTSTNEGNVYVRYNSIKPSNNLRDMYLRAVQLGSDEELYSKTNVFKIQKAFRKSKRSFQEKE
ncbi:AAA family ATPase [Streptococcus uberis]|nr:AAA family ATPase [Streptococcus uberis]MCK1202117.1 AAA family ATPase [Streptococcus uberis]